MMAALGGLISKNFVRLGREYHHHIWRLFPETLWCQKWSATSETFLQFMTWTFGLGEARHGIEDVFLLKN